MDSRAGSGNGSLFVIEGNQSRHIHDPVIHPSPFGPPRNAFHEPFEQEVGAGHPIAMQLHPGAVRKEGSFDAAAIGEDPTSDPLSKRVGWKIRAIISRIAGDEHTFVTGSGCDLEARLSVAVDPGRSDAGQRCGPAPPWSVVGIPVVVRSPGGGEDLTEQEAKPVGIDVGTRVVGADQLGGTFGRGPLPSRAKGDAQLAVAAGGWRIWSVRR